MTIINITSRETPIAVLMARGIIGMEGLGEALETKGWATRRAADPPQCREIVDREAVSLVLLAQPLELPVAGDLVKTIRTAPGPSRMAPIVLLGETMPKTDPNPMRVDATISAQGAPCHIARELEQWWPVSLEPTRRIATILGPGPIGGMIERLGVRLEAALRMLADEHIDRGEAHRLAGLCGTLGFAQAHAAWLDLSMGEGGSLDEARRTTRLTLAAIARGL